ncbi:hypothetical protein [Mesorhizobium sp. M1A.F.Ca.IN.022.07.1.1]|uniref:hypothetical protein n=1 Tax=Mesorhizobium sp. M1A.F.Ca.IN.022.07.1.1 TaxID=2496767 RepID=UPI000FCBD3F1|nr:hypothetical protein [Mesorhizobium sp. M1A.F.Ca.IN.022.07.1.1]
MFGYLAFVSLFLSVGAILLIAAAEPVKALVAYLTDSWGAIATRGIGGLVAVAFNFVLAHLLVTTCHGLYYLIDRLYAQKPKLLPKEPENNGR